jgi:hypothetical protein
VPGVPKTISQASDFAELSSLPSDDLQLIQGGLSSLNRWAMLAFTEVTTMQLLSSKSVSGKSVFGKSQSGKSRRILASIFFFVLLLAFTLLAASTKGAAQTQRLTNRPSGRASQVIVPYRYDSTFNDPIRASAPYTAAMQAQARLDQAQQSHMLGNPEQQIASRHFANQREPQQLAQPDAPDQSDLLKNSKDPDFILRNFRTMWVDAREAEYFDSYQMKAALGRNKEFLELNIHVVDDPSVADVLLHVGYTFAWDYPFQLKHQNTTVVLLAGKGQGPFSGPLGAADVAREFVKAVKRSRSLAKEPAKSQPK